MRSDGFKDTLFICGIIVLFFTCAVIPSCVTVVTPGTAPVTTTVPMMTTTSVKPFHPIFNPSWEKNHPERVAWSDVVYTGLMNDFSNILTATDWVRFCPKWDTLTTDYKMDAAAEMFAWLTFYESSWDEASAGVDVGTAANRDTYSIGLCQVSVVDTQNKWKYTYEQLLHAKENLTVCMNIFSEQVRATGLIVLPNTHKKRYFATLLDGNRYDKTPFITAKVAALPFCK